MAPSFDRAAVLRPEKRTRQFERISSPKRLASIKTQTMDTYRAKCRTEAGQ